jgi:hypothetical protein
MAAMPDQLAFPALVFVAGGLIALSLVWPQGQGAASPAPFGRPLRGLEQVVGGAHGSPMLVRGSQGADAPAARRRSHPAARP